MENGQSGLLLAEWLWLLSPGWKSSPTCFTDALHSFSLGQVVHCQWMGDFPPWLTLYL